MTVYVDSSVLLRILLREPGRLTVWGRITRPISSELIRVECLRTIDRARILFGLPDREVVRRRTSTLEAIRGFSLVPLDAAVVERAAHPFPILVETIDALHLASALRARTRAPDLALATHDSELAMAARAVGLKVYGA